MILKGLKISSHTLWPHSRAVFSIHHGKYQALDVGAYSELLAGKFCIDGQHLG